MNAATHASLQQSSLLLLLFLVEQRWLHPDILTIEPIDRRPVIPNSCSSRRDPAFHGAYSHFVRNVQFRKKKCTKRNDHWLRNILEVDLLLGHCFHTFRYHSRILKNEEKYKQTAPRCCFLFHNLSSGLGPEFLVYFQSAGHCEWFFFSRLFFLLFLHLGLNLTFWIRVFQKLGYYTSRKARKFQFLRCQTIRLVQSRLQSFSLFLEPKGKQVWLQANKHNKINRYYKTGCWWIEEKAAEKRSHQHIIKPFHRVLYLISD